MNHSAPPKISLKIELCKELNALLAKETNFSDPFLSRLEEQLGALVAELGVPGEPAITLKSGSAGKPLQIRLHNQLLPYPEELIRPLWEALGVGELGKLPLTFGAQAWLNAVISPPPGAAGEPAAVFAVEIPLLADFLAGLVIEIIRLQPEKLPAKANAQAYRALGRQLLPDSLCGALDKFSAERLLNLLRSLLKLRISIAETETVLTRLCESLQQRVSDEEIAESLIAHLRPLKIDIEIHPDYLRQIHPAPPESAEAAPLPETLSVWSEQADPRLRETFTLFSDGMFYELGVRSPGVRFVADKTLPPKTFAIRINHLRSQLYPGLAPGQILVNETPARLADYGLPGAALAVNPANRRENSLADASQRQKLEAEGLTVWDEVGYIVLALAAEVRRHAACLIDKETLEYDLALLDQAFPEIISAALARYSPAQLAGVVRDLSAEGLSVRDLRSILERLLHYQAVVTDPSKYIIFDDSLAMHPDIGVRKTPGREQLAQFARSGLRQYLSHKYTYGRWQSTLNVYLLDTQWETRLVEHLAFENGDRGKKPLSDGEIENLRQGIRSELALLPQTPGYPLPAILTIACIRKRVRDLLEREFPGLAVLSYDELSPSTNITPVARISWTEA